MKKIIFILLFPGIIRALEGGMQLLSLEDSQKKGNSLLKNRQQIKNTKKSVLEGLRADLSDIIKQAKNKEEQEKLINKRQAMRLKNFGQQRHKNREEQFAKLRNNYQLIDEMLTLQVLNLVENEELRTLETIMSLEKAIHENRAAFEDPIEKFELLNALATLKTLSISQ